MTLHVHYSHQCRACDAHYIPYDTDVPCPRCGAVEAKRFDFIPRAVESIRYNKERYGSYVPPGWWVGSLADHILLTLFQLFHRYEATGGATSFEVFASNQLGQVNWDDQQYLKGHVLAIALRLRAELDRG